MEIGRRHKYFNRYEEFFQDSSRLDLSVCDAFAEAIAPLKALNEIISAELPFSNSIHDSRIVMRHLLVLLSHFITDYEYIKSLRERTLRGEVDFER